MVMAEINVATITGVIQDGFSFTGTMDIGIDVLNMYDIAVENGYEGTFDQWVHDMCYVWCDIADFYIDPATGYLMGTYDIDKYTFNIDDSGYMVITLKGGDES